MSKTKPTYTEQLLERQVTALESIAHVTLRAFGGPLTANEMHPDIDDKPEDWDEGKEKTASEKVVDAANAMTDEEWQGYDLKEAKEIIAEFISENGPDIITATFESAQVEKLSDLTDVQRDKICTKIIGKPATEWRKTS